MPTGASGKANINRLLRGHVGDPLYLHSYFLLGSTAAAAGSGFVFWVIAARLTDPTSVGRASALLSAITLLTFLTSLGLPYGMLRFAGVREGSASMLNGAMVATSLTSVLASVVFVAGVELWAPDLEGMVDGVTEVALFALANAFVSLAVLLDNVFAARRTAQYALGRNVVTAVLKLAAAVPLAAYGAMGLYAANVIPLVLVGAVSILVLPRLVEGYRFSARPRGTATKKLFSFSLGTYPSSLLAGAPPFFLPLIVLGVGGAREAAFFYVSWSVIGVLLLVPNVISNMSLSEGARDLPWRTARKARTFALVLVLPLTAVLAIFAPSILSIFGPEYAKEAVGPLRVFALSLLPWTFKLFALSALRAEASYRTLTFAVAVFAGCSLIGTTALGARHGLMGVAVGWTVGLTVAAVTIEFLVYPFRQRERIAIDAVAAGDTDFRV